MTLSECLLVIALILIFGSIAIAAMYKDHEACKEKPIPINIKWFEIQAKDKSLQDNEAVARWLAEVTEITRQEIAKQRTTNKGPTPHETFN